MTLTGKILIVVSTLLFMLFLENFLHILPYLADSVFRARGSTALENSVRVRRDRDIVALIFLIPLFLIVYYYRLYTPDFLEQFSADAAFWLTTGVVVLFLVLRFLLTLWFAPRRRRDNYMDAYRAGFTFFILMMILVLPTVGLLSVFKASPTAFRWVILSEIIVLYGLYLFRRAQILSSSCSNLTTFLYLCALEFLPSGLLVASAVVL